MKKIEKIVLVAVIAFFGVNAAHAQSEIEKLIEQTGIEAADAVLNVVDPELGY